MSKLVDDIKKRLVVILLVLYVLPLAIGLAVNFLASLAPFVLVGWAVMAVGWLLWRLLQHYR